VQHGTNTIEGTRQGAVVAAFATTFDRRKKDNLETKKETSSAIEIPAGREPVREILTLPDGYETSVFIHSPSDGQVTKMPVLYIHGIQSHSGWFFGSAMQMAANGSEVYQVTRRGSGDNMCAKGHAHSVKQLMQDVSAAIDFICERSGCDKIHLMGVSWGGKLAVGYALQMNDDRLASLTCIAPGLFPKVDVPLRMKLAIAASLFVHPQKTFAIPLNEPELFTDNPAMREFLHADPLRLHKATAKFLFVSKMLDKQLQRSGKIKISTQLILSSNDKIIDNHPTREFFERTCDDLHITELTGAHTLEFEPDPTPLYDILSRAVAGATCK
jgi:acylglycerol lipase